ncbi:MAG: NAD(P)-dependent oxidoreductase [Candidatus Omnitrophota bacterium]
MDCIFFEAFQEEQELLRQFLPKNILAEFTPKTVQEFGALEPPASVISIRTQSNIPIAWAKSLKGILSRSAGYDHIMDFRNQSKADIPCGYLPKYCARAVAEQAIMMALMLLRKARAQSAHLATFNRDGLTGQELQGRNMLIIGVGNIGSEIAQMAKSLCMSVKGVDKDPKSKEIEYVSLTDGLKWADVVFCALPLTWLTRGMLNYGTLKNAQEGTIFINVARGEISPLGDLERLLDDGVLGGLGLDVFEDENKIAHFLRNPEGEADENTQIVLRLEEKENCIFTPHNAFNTAEAVIRKAQQSTESIEKFLKEGRFVHPVPQEARVC